MESQEIKSLVPVLCPHCSKQIVVAFKMSAPQLTSVLTVDMIEKAKGEVIARIGALPLSMEQKQPALDWINNPETIFGPDDIDEIIKNIQNNDPIKEN